MCWPLLAAVYWISSLPNKNIMLMTK